MRTVAAESTRKCWPSLGLPRRFSAAAIFVTLSRFPAGVPAFTLASSFCRLRCRSGVCCKQHPMIACAGAPGLALYKESA